METLNELAKLIGFTNFIKMIMFIGMLTLIALLPYLFWLGNKDDRK